MKNSMLLLFVVAALAGGSCKSSKKAADSPYLTEDNSKTEITVRTEKVKPVDKQDKVEHRFYVIIGSFKSVDNARMYKTDLVADGFTPVILENENGLFRVSVGAYDDENAARLKIKGIRNAYTKYNDVWLLVRK